MNTPSESMSTRLSGVDPFRARPEEAGAGEEQIEQVWFDAPPSSRRASMRPSAPPSAAPPIGDRDADTWFR